LELPFFDCLLIFNFLLGVNVFILPFLKNFNALSNELKGHLRSLHLEYLRDVNLSLYFFANLKRNTRKNLFKLIFLSVYVSRNSPNELETGQKRWQSFFNELKVTLLDVAKLPVECRQEFNKIPSLSLLLNEFTILMIEVIKSRTLVTLLLSVLQNLLYSLNPIKIQLLEQRIKSGTTLSPVLGLTGG
jgi:hypothetical protein